MKLVIAVLAAASLAKGIEYNGFRVKYGLSDALVDKEYFFSLPLSASNAEAKGWHLTKRPPGPMPELKMYCSTGRNVCPLYDVKGFIAGLQVAIPVDGFEHPSIWTPENKLVKWIAPAADGEPEKEYWTVTQYYVSEESLKAGAGPTKENGATLQYDGVWVPGPDGNLMRIPSSETELSNTFWKKQNCIPGMGTHYHYNMTPELNCEKVFHWFVTTTESQLVAVGLQIIGKIPEQNPDWFESFPDGSAQMTIPLAPQCLYDEVEEYGVISLHIYFTDKPWTIKCKDSDSIKTHSMVDKLKLNAAKIFGKITGEVKNIFN